MPHIREPMPPLAWWGGIECTVNRVGNRYFDQIERSGHAWRISDLERFAELGFTSLRYPILWERTSPEGIERIDWRWADERLERMRALGLSPIVGLLHHGSGPRYTNLLDPRFPEKLAAYAGAVARRYPWVERFTPVNEPLTTARFSGMYGVWYPHGEDDATFCRALLNQCRGIALAMDAIREVNPSAQLVQTEDLGITFATPPLAYQAEYENQRRWLSFDLLCGRVDVDHPLYEYFTWLGIPAADVDWFLDHPCQPDILGANFYLTSERFLDHRLDRYPATVHGSNGRQAYADVEAVRVRAEGLHGPYGLLHEVWSRYRRPLAVTEVHNGCTREEQLRWALDVVNAVEALRDEGVPVIAITAWSMLGAYDWNSLLTRDAGVYEPGLFDLRSPEPRPTALAHLFKNLAAGRRPRDPVLDAPGWWRRHRRLLYEPIQSTDEAPPPFSRVRQPRPRVTPRSRPLLILGGRGTLGVAFSRLCDLRGLPAVALARPEADLNDRASLERVLEVHQPWAVVNAAGFVHVDDAEREAEACRRANAAGPALLAALCAEREVGLVTFSTDLVFDGCKRVPYVESDVVSPLSVYGRSKAEAERDVLSVHPGALVVRTSAFFGPWDAHNFLTLGLRALAGGQTWWAADDAVVSPTYVPDLVHAALDLLIDGEKGLWHLANQGSLSWYDFALMVARRAGVGTDRICGKPLYSFAWAAQRPLYSVLGSERGALLPTLENAIDCYLADSGHYRAMNTTAARAIPTPTR